MFETKGRDKYGRTTYDFAAQPFRTLVACAVLPKVWVEHNDDPSKGRYLVNDWQMPVWDNETYVGDAPGKVTYCHSLKEARALAAHKIATGTGVRA